MIKTPPNVPDIDKVLVYHPYSTIDPYKRGEPIFQREYHNGDQFDQVQQALQKELGHEDNKHGWEVLDPQGTRLLFWFYDRDFYVFRITRITCSECNGDGWINAERITGTDGILLPQDDPGRECDRCEGVGTEPLRRT